MIKNYLRLEEETATTRKLLLFYQSGGNIFNINPFSIDLPKKTEVENIHLQAVKLPYPSIYFHFDPISEIEFSIES